MEELWDIARVAEYLGVSQRTVYNGELDADYTRRRAAEEDVLEDLERPLRGRFEL